MNWMSWMMPGSLLRQGVGVIELYFSPVLFYVTT